ncbi:Anaerobic sulfatase-maturating enzyme [Anaerolineales bacterium]|nr:Anaerobic sulfatase-maturating enzyme [Anaerolineales bacterium]
MGDRNFQYIHLFRTLNHHYCYVAHTNALIELDIETWGLLRRNQINEEHGAFLENESVSVLRTVLSEAGTVSLDTPKLIHSPWTQEEIVSQLEKNLSQLTLVVTEFCNLQCDYCLYGDLYPAFRNNSSRRMSRNVAKSAIDFFFKRCKKDIVTVGFYGGEPLTNFKLIEYCLRYISQIRSPNLVQYSMTTNGTLLTPDKVRVLHDYDVSLLVSLDGPKNIHDRHRVAKKKEGTFSKILENITWIKENYPDYYCTKIGFNVVRAPDTDIREVYAFFRNHPSLFINNSITSSNIISYPETIFDHFVESNSHQGIKNLRKQFIESGKKMHLEQDTFLRAIFERPLIQIHKRQHWEGFSNCYPPNGICLPGTRKLLVNIDGGVQMCERVSTTDTIGNIYDGFNYKKIYSLIDEYIQLGEKACINCWAIRLCSMCFSDVYDGVLSSTRKKWACNRMKNMLSENLRLYCEVLEKNPNAYDYMKNIFLS